MDDLRKFTTRLIRITVMMPLIPEFAIIMIGFVKLKPLVTGFVTAFETSIGYPKGEIPVQISQLNKDSNGGVLCFDGHS